VVAEADEGMVAEADDDTPLKRNKKHSQATKRAKEVVAEADEGMVAEADDDTPLKSAGGTCRCTCGGACGASANWCCECKVKWHCYAHKEWRKIGLCSRKDSWNKGVRKRDEKRDEKRGRRARDIPRRIFVCNNRIGPVWTV